MLYDAVGGYPAGENLSTMLEGVAVSATPASTFLIGSMIHKIHRAEYMINIII